MSAGAEALQMLKLLIDLYPLPWKVDDTIEPGVVFDAVGKCITAVDVWGDLPDPQVSYVALVIQVAVNEWAERQLALSAMPQQASAQLHLVVGGLL